MHHDQALAALSALANATRLELVRTLVGAGPEGLAASDIAGRLGISASRLSFHLAALEQAGLVTARRAARNIFYAASAGGLGGVISYLLNDCCAAHPEVSACCTAAKVTPRPEP
ncbi:ArsR/SmtB family transcription factor [Albidovulum sp.]|uniref:ArsR/SmtB family transcription factor n=1 Tax=Albidovulum sp. TaxID=1872424 RepID=UPI0039B97521